MLENLGFHPKYLETWKLLWKKKKKRSKVSIRKCCSDTLWVLLSSGTQLSTFPADWQQLLCTPPNLHVFLLSKKGCHGSSWWPSLSYILEAWEEWGSQTDIPVRYHSRISEMNFCWLWGFSTFQRKVKKSGRKYILWQKKVVNTQSSIEKNVGQDFFFLTSFNKRAINTFLEHCK